MFNVFDGAIKSIENASGLSSTSVSVYENWSLAKFICFSNGTRNSSKILVGIYVLFNS